MQVTGKNETLRDAAVAIQERGLPDDEFTSVVGAGGVDGCVGVQHPVLVLIVGDFVLTNSRFGRFRTIL